MEFLAPLSSAPLAIMDSEGRLLKVIICVDPSIYIIITIFFVLTMLPRLNPVARRPPRRLQRGQRCQRQPPSLKLLLLDIMIITIPPSVEKRPYEPLAALASQPPLSPRRRSLALCLVPPPPWVRPLSRGELSSKLIIRHMPSPARTWRSRSMITSSLPSASPHLLLPRHSHPGRPKSAEQALSETRPVTALVVDAGLRARLDGRRA